jgi:hypothetical protein
LIIRSNVQPLIVLHFILPVSSSSCRISFLILGSVEGINTEITASFGIEIDCPLQLSYDRGKTPDGNNFVLDLKIYFCLILYLLNEILDLFLAVTI